MNSYICKSSSNPKEEFFVLYLSSLSSLLGKKKVLSPRDLHDSFEYAFHHIDQYVINDFSVIIVSVAPFHQERERERKRKRETKRETKS